MTAPYYSDDSVTLYHGDCREITDWLSAAVLVCDPPYGRNWRQGDNLPRPNRRSKSRGRDGIAGDSTTEVRDQALALWGDRPAIAFGDLMLPPPAGTKLVGVYRKPVDAGVRGAIGGFRRDAEAIYLVGPWPSGIGGRSSVLATNARSLGNPYGVAARSGHSLAKPVDLMEELIAACPEGVVADPFAGSGSTLIAARNLGRHAIGVELEAHHCATIARRLAQDVLPIGGMT